MSSLMPRGPGGPPPSSPFDPIRQVRPDGSDYWSARALSPLLGYARYGKFAAVLDRTREDLENQGHVPGDHMHPAVNMVPIGSGATRAVEDWHLSRLACYLACMNAGTPEGSTARQYFAVRTREAETACPPAPRQTLEVYTRRILDARRGGMRVRHGFWTVFDKSAALLIVAEAVYLRLGLPLDRFDLLDGSVGTMWARYRDDKPWAEPWAYSPYTFPDHRGTRNVKSYVLSELGHFDHWLKCEYEPFHFAGYLQTKYGRGAVQRALPAFQEFGVLLALAGPDS